MNKNVAMIRKIGGLGLAGAMAFGSAGATAADFGVSAQVQNTLAVTVVQPMALGSIFAASASSGLIGSLVLEPTGGMVAGETGVVIKSLGGQAAARGSVATDQNFTVNVPTATIVTSTHTGPNEVTAVADIVEVRIGGAAGDPNVARLYLANFTVGDVTDGAITGGPYAAGAAVTLDPAFGATAVAFGIGAEVITDDSGTRTGYEAGTYEGTFTVTAEF